MGHEVKTFIVVVVVSGGLSVPRDGVGARDHPPALPPRRPRAPPGALRHRQDHLLPLPLLRPVRALLGDAGSARTRARTQTRLPERRQAQPARY